MEEEIRHWIQQINDETILPSDIVAFNFGLFESEEGYCIYLTGSKFYDESDDDWACDIDFEPNRKYLMLASGSIQNMNWKQILYKVKNIIFNFITANAYKLPLFSDEAKYAEEENRKLGEIPRNPRMEITKERTSNDRKGTTSKKSKKGNTALMWHSSTKRVSAPRPCSSSSSCLCSCWNSTSVFCSCCLMKTSMSVPRLCNP